MMRYERWPSDEDGIGLWVNDLEIGAHGADVAEARRNPIGAVRAHVANFLGALSVYLTRPDRARLVPLVLRLAMARDDADRARILLGMARSASGRRRLAQGQSEGLL